MSRLAPIGGAVAVVVVDQLVKAVVRAEVPQGALRPVMPGVDIVHTENSGVSFGALAGLPTWAVGAVSFGALVVVVLLLRRTVPGRLGAAAGALIAGGAIGNLVDRVRAGAVTDFVDVPLIPPFNVADAAITVGAALLAGVLLLDGSSAAKRPRREAT